MVSRSIGVVSSFWIVDCLDQLDIALHNLIYKVLSCLSRLQFDAGCDSCSLLLSSKCLADYFLHFLMHFTSNHHFFCTIDLNFSMWHLCVLQFALSRISKYLTYSFVFAPCDLFCTFSCTLAHNILFLILILWTFPAFFGHALCFTFHACTLWQNKWYRSMWQL